MHHMLKNRVHKKGMMHAFKCLYLLIAEECNPKLLVSTNSEHSKHELENRAFEIDCKSNLVEFKKKTTTLAGNIIKVHAELQD